MSVQLNSNSIQDAFHVDHKFFISIQKFEFETPKKFMSIQLKSISIKSIRDTQEVQDLDPLKDRFEIFELDQH